MDVGVHVKPVIPTVQWKISVYVSFSVFFFGVGKIDLCCSLPYNKRRSVCFRIIPSRNEIK